MKFKASSRSEESAGRVSGATRHPGKLSGFSLVELMISMAVATIILGAVGAVYLTVAREQRKGVVDAVMEQRIGNLQDKVTGVLRSMSSTQSAIWADACPAWTNGAPVMFYRKIIVSKGEPDIYPQEELYFDTTNLRVIYDPNRAVTGDEQVLFQGNNNSVVLRDFFFSSGFKAGPTPDSTLINVYMVMDDNKNGGTRYGSSQVQTRTVTRHFAVRMRAE